MDEESFELEPSRGRSVKVPSPESVFKEWAYEVGSQHYAAFELKKREFRKAGHKTMEWSIMKPMTFAFEVGDMFYLSSAPGRIYLQVAALWPGGQLEVHSGEWYAAKREAYVVSPEFFAVWLKTGLVPAAARRIFKGNSKAGSLAYRLPQ